MFKLKQKITKKTGSIFVVPTALLVVILSLVYLNQNKPLSEKDKSLSENIPVQTNDKINLPLNLNSRNITTVYLAYNFFGPIKELRKVPDGVQIILDTSEENLPLFLVNDRDTKIFIIKNDRQLPTSIDDLKPGLQVAISTTYDLKYHIWVTRTIHIPLSP